MRPRRQVLPDEGQLQLPGMPPAVVVDPRDRDRGARHALERVAGGVRCMVCSGAWTRGTTTACPGVRLYRTWSEVPEGLRSRSAWRKAGRLVPADAAVDAVVEAHADAPRRMLYAEAKGVPVRPLTAAQQAALQRRRRCGREGCEAEGLLARRLALGEGLLAVGRICLPHYREAWHLRQKQLLVEALADLGEDDVSIDLETTGLLGAPWPVEVGAWARGALVYRSRVRPPPEAEWEPGAIAVHGIRPEDVAGERSWDQVLPELVAALSPFLGAPPEPRAAEERCDDVEVEGPVEEAVWDGGMWWSRRAWPEKARARARLWAWGELDGRVLWGASNRVGASWPWAVWDACMWWSLRAWPETAVRVDSMEPRPDRPRWRLREACETAGVRPGDHSAGEDARALGQCLEWMRAGASAAEPPARHPLAVLAAAFEAAP